METLHDAWQTFLTWHNAGNQLYADYNKMREEARKMTVEINKTYAEIERLHRAIREFDTRRNRLYKDSRKLRETGISLLNEGENYFLTQVVEKRGHVKIEWTEVGCTVGDEHYHY